MKNLKFNCFKEAYGTNLQQGGAALEYVVVSVFGLVLSIGAIAFISDSIESKFSKLEEAVGIEFDMKSLNPFSSDTP
ncbi:hypothetical protein [Pseudobacteriovorax antillogorgiicola]|uniref:Uncharacterized protein n=1 Tax=Pseudobacteriovorax antillogorgiicola TaxID=1513793 RepID=A0A1Y6CBK4_9BACT|nr:hypothetical protein [Pseudobacteriovorax antillogorgiicola]TCS48594.1 hypothetical protein EDD56_11716 [Pseudobacteriovorax antillogorgiicola]SMF55629.1 hypothetical protein SAMN06296036_117143 [Pseudobacteriovorax antillogorgiicola]